MAGKKHIQSLLKSTTADSPGGQRLTLKIPASSANLGPGFDALALSLKLYCTLHFELLDHDNKSVPLISLSGMNTKGLAVDSGNLVYAIIKDLWRNDTERLSRLRIQINNDIPLSRGLGSSAAAVVGAIYAAYALTESNVDKSVLLAKAMQIEGHADNAAASLLGGLTICASSSNSRGVITKTLQWPEKWRALAIVPPYALSTKEARAVLPNNISRAEAVANIQNVGLLIHAIYQKDDECLKNALCDKLHERYRMRLVPELAQVRKALSDFPILGCVLSGAGSSILIIVHQRHKSQVYAYLTDWAARQQQPCGVLDLEVDQEGLLAFYE